MRLIRTVISFVAGMIVGYAVSDWDIELPEQMHGYVQQLEDLRGDFEKMRDKKELLEAEVERLQKLVEDQ